MIGGHKRLVTQQGSEAGDVRLERIHSGGGGTLRPDHIYQSIGAHGVVHGEHQHAEQRLHTPSGDSLDDSGPLDRKRTQHKQPCSRAHGNVPRLISTVPTPRNGVLEALGPRPPDVRSGSVSDPTCLCAISRAGATLNGTRR